MNTTYFIRPNPAGPYYYDTLEKAIEVAEKLSIQNPATTYKILQVVGEVHAKPITTIFEKFAKGRFLEDGEPNVKLPELPEGYEWEYRGLGWDSNGREVELTTLGTWQENRIISNKVMKCIAQGSTDVHYWEKVEVKPSWKIGDVVEAGTIGGWKRGHVEKIYSDGAADVFVFCWAHTLARVTPDRLRKVTQ